KATEGKVVTVTFNSQLCLATISLDNRINTTLNLEASRAILIKEDISSKIINKHAGFIIDDVPVCICTDGNQDNELFSQVDENDKLNSDYEVTKGIGKNISPKRIQRTEDKQINKISKITKKDQNLILRENISGDDGSDDDSPRWSECEECYGSKKEFCDLCGCSVCKWNGDRGYILLCDRYCGKGFYIRCLKPPLARIPARNWYCMRCSKKLKHKTQSDDLSSSDNVRKIKNQMYVEDTESTDDEVVNDSQMVRHGKKWKSPSNCLEKYKKKVHLDLPRDIKEKEQMRYSSSETESDEYVDSLKEARRIKEITENFASHNPGKIFEMFSQSIDQYFNKDPSEASLESEQFSKIIEDIQGCTKYLAIWNLHFNN
ncbi:3190_t:CDS:2, partial [Racocetra persica]